MDIRLARVTRRNVDRVAGSDASFARGNEILTLDAVRPGANELFFLTLRCFVNVSPGILVSWLFFAALVEHSLVYILWILFAR